MVFFLLLPYYGIPEPYLMGCREKVYCVFKLPHETYEGRLSYHESIWKKKRREREGGTEKGVSGGGGRAAPQLPACWSFGDSEWLVKRQGQPFSPDLSPASRKCVGSGVTLPIPHTQAGLAVLTSVREPLHPVLEITQVTVTLPGVVPHLQ